MGGWCKETRWEGAVRERQWRAAGSRLFRVPACPAPTLQAKANRRRAWSRQASAYSASLDRKSREVEARAEAAAAAASDAGLAASHTKAGRGPVCSSGRPQ